MPTCDARGHTDMDSALANCVAVHSICTGVAKNMQRHFEVKGAGHYGIFAGRRWRDMVYPQVKAFILAHQPKARPADASQPRVAAKKSRRLAGRLGAPAPRAPRKP